MKSSTSIKSGASAGIFAAIVASLCCITPVLAFTSGISGIAATFSWVEPFRPYLIGFTVLVLGFAWYQKLKPRTQEEIDCACEEDEKPSFWQSRKFLGIVTLFAGLMLAFPSYSHVFYPEINKSVGNDANELMLATFEIEGMTCSGCEEHIVHAASIIPGVESVQASYQNKSAHIAFSANLVKIEEIEEAINKTGYEIVSMSIEEYQPDVSGNFSFYSVPLVCNAAPTLGCGSRSKPILDSFTSSNIVTKAWLSRSGEYIAIEWADDFTLPERAEVVESVSKLHKIEIDIVSGPEGLELNSAFSSKDGWYLGEEVFELSSEEAGIIAGRIINLMKQVEGNSLDFVSEAKFRNEIQDIFYTWFSTVSSLDELSDIDEYKTRLQEVVSLAGNYEGLKEMPGMDDLLTACSGECEHAECIGTSCELTAEYVQLDNPFVNSEGYKSADLKVEGMTCTGCEPHLQAELSSIEGISEIKVSYEKSNAIITYDTSRVTVKRIKNAIQEAGYKVVDNE